MFILILFLKLEQINKIAQKYMKEGRSVQNKLSKSLQYK